MNITRIIVVGVFIALVLSVLKLLYKMISYKGPSKRRQDKKQSSHKKANIQAHALNYKMLTAPTDRFSNYPSTSFNMKTLQCKIDKPERFMRFKGLYAYMKSKNPPLPVENVENDYSDNSI